MRSDLKIYRDVLQRLHSLYNVNSQNITIKVTNGIVELTGTVECIPEKYIAEGSVNMIMGVRKVLNDLQVRLNGGARLTDQDITNLIQSAMEWDLNIPNDSIQATVHDGIVTLTGEVNWQYQRKIAEEATRCLPCVKLVCNNIVVKRKLTINYIKMKMLKKFH